MKVLIVEDDQALAENVRLGLGAKSHIVDVATNGADGSFMGRSYPYDAIILDHALPKKDGLTVCREIRASGKSTPILFLSVIGDTDTKVRAFEEGADDYVTKPFSMIELSARLDAMARRSPQIKSPIITVDNVNLNTETQTVERGGTPLHLTRKEFNLLSYLMHHAGVVMSRSLIMEHVWTAESDPYSNTVEAHIRNVRKKLTAHGHADLIINLPGRGYVIDTPENLSKF
ncbi:MAG: response regulator transcription factor [Patescibacteria group bacterium]